MADAKPQAKPKAKPKQKGTSAPSGKEINVIGTFRNPWSGDEAEVKAMKASSWSPTSTDFKAVAGNSQQIETYLQLLSVILLDGKNESKNGSIRRINIFTHANKDLLAFTGPITTSGSVSLAVNSALSMETLQNLGQGATFNIAGVKKTFTMADVRRRFTKDAVIVIYACHSAMDGKFVQQIADTFQVKVRGFQKVIGYYPSYDDDPKFQVTNRRRMGIDYNSQVKVADFHDLDSDSTAVEKSPTAPSE